MLSGLGRELVWATAWIDDANKVIAPLLGLPRLPVADLPEYSDDLGDDRLQWKTKALGRIADGRPPTDIDETAGWVPEVERR